MIARLSVPFQDFSRNRTEPGAVFSRWFAGFERISVVVGRAKRFRRRDKAEDSSALRAMV
jgi:hypothetical protein